jgi:hypothetical protein
MKITASSVAYLARQAFDNGQLQAQAPTAATQGCKYAGPCAIGVALPLVVRHWLDAIASDTSIERLLAQGLIEAPEEDHLLLIELQEAHDNAATRYLQRDALQARLRQVISDILEQRPFVGPTVKLNDAHYWNLQS